MFGWHHDNQPKGVARLGAATRELPCANGRRATWNYRAAQGPSAWELSCRPRNCRAAWHSKLGQSHCCPHHPAATHTPCIVGKAGNFAALVSICWPHHSSCIAGKCQQLCLLVHAAAPLALLALWQRRQLCGNFATLAIPLLVAPPALLALWACLW